MHERQGRGLDKKQMVIGSGIGNLKVEVKGMGQEMNTPTIWLFFLKVEVKGMGQEINTPTIWLLFYSYLVWLSFTPK
jgi:hypothetical protein